MKSVGCLLLVLALGCGGSDKDKRAAPGNAQATNRDSLTERQRDSILAGSRIPGARGVGKAMRVADSTSAEIEQTNAVARDTTPF
ncbi:MAG TPA: hypothetical protein VKQ05_12215 [Gemmatimonadales bacterium]|nr:hypothetical protein [Gemmatimonadales bacterium]